MKNVRWPSGRDLDDATLRIIEAMYDAGTVRWSDKPFNLKSGGTSHVYFMGREDLTLNPRLLTSLSRQALKHLWESSEEASCTSNCFIGVPLAGAAIAHWMAAISYLTEGVADSSFLAMRQVRKQHGNNCTWIDGKPPKNATVVLVENVRTTGSSEEEALQRIREDGIEVPILRLALVDRRLREETDIMKSVFYMADIVVALAYMGKWSNKQTSTALHEFMESA